MLTPARNNSLAPSQLVGADPTPVPSATSDPKVKANTPDGPADTGTRTSKFSKLADLLAGSENSIANPLIKLALAIAHEINFQQKPNEIADAYRRRLIDFLLDMKPDEQAEVEHKSNLRSFDITLPLLAEAMKDHATPIAAKLIVMIEQAAGEAKVSFEDQASHLYEDGEDGHAEMADSLKYRSLPPQGEILEADPKPENAKPGETVTLQARENTPKQAQLVRAFVDELYDATKSLDDLFTFNDEQQPDETSPLPEAPNPKVLEPQNDERRSPVPSTSVRAANDLSFVRDSGPVAESAVQPQIARETREASKLVEVALTEEPQISGDKLPRTETEKLIAPLKAGIQAMISERLTSFASLAPRVSERQIAATISPSSTQAPAVQKEPPAPVTVDATPQRVPINLHDPAFVAKLTTLFLKDLPPATLAKLQVIADLLIANELGLLSEFLSEEVKSREGADAKSALTTASEFVAGKAEERIKDQATLPRAFGSGKLDDTATSSVIRNIQISDDPEQPAQTQGRNPPIGAPSNPAERIAQQIQLFNMLAFTPIPYPIIDEQEPPSNRKPDDKQDESEERDEDGERGGSHPDREHQQQHQETKQDEPAAGADNPFAPDVELKRHSTDAERAFHMYQKMGGF